MNSDTLFAAAATDDEAIIINTTRLWIERAVIGLNLCPFAKSVYTKNQIRYVVSTATHIDALAEDLMRELEYLAETSAEKIDTTLLIHPQVMGDFLDFNDFLDVADRIVAELQLDGILQVASFHPQFQFEGTDAEDISNYSNRSPYPILHLLREDSVERAVAAFSDELAIANNNIRNLRALGHEGWDTLWSASFPKATIDSP